MTVDCLAHTVYIVIGPSSKHESVGAHTLSGFCSWNHHTVNREHTQVPDQSESLVTRSPQATRKILKERNPRVVWFDGMCLVQNRLLRHKV